MTSEANANDAIGDEHDHFSPSLEKRIEGLDELRGIAILLVLVAHFFHFREISTDLQYFNLGGIGVDLFFVISGFLIATILRKFRGEKNYFRRFYVRRIFRIIPLFLVVFALGAVLAIGTGKGIVSWPFYLTFTQNLLAESPPFGDLFEPKYEAMPGLSPLWSLAVEEHTYLLLPALIAFTTPNTARSSLIVLAIIGIGLKNYVTQGYGDTWLVYSNPHETWFRMQYIAFGAIMAFPNVTRSLTVIAVAWCILNFIFGRGHLEFAIALILCAGVGMCVAGTPPLKIRSLARMGFLCYGIYLWHVFIMIAFEKTGLPAYVRFPLFLVSCFCFAEMSLRYFEMPVQQLRTRFESPRST